MPQVPQPQRIVVPFDGHVIGQGVDSDSATRVGTGLVPAEVVEDPVAAGQAGSFHFRMITSQQSLERSLNLDAELDVRYGLFSGGAKASFAEESALNTSSTYILASAVVSNATRFGRNFSPTESAGRLIGLSDDGAAFRGAFGDRFVEALRTGGEFYALVRVTSSNFGHQRRVAASLHAEYNGLTAGGSFSAALSEAKSDTSSFTDVEISVRQLGGQGGDLKIPGIEAARVREHMNAFVSAVHANSVAFAAELVSYDTLALPFALGLVREDTIRVLEDCQELKKRYWSALSDLRFARERDAPLIFSDLPSEDQLNELDRRFRMLLASLMRHARGVAAGSIEPTPFVPEDQPSWPRFTRRNAVRFREWWAQSNAKLLSDDDDRLVQSVGNFAGREFLGVQFPNTVPPDTAPEIVEAAAMRLKRLVLPISLPSRPLRSVSSLPRMLDAPLEEFQANGALIEDISGLAPYSRLKRLHLTECRIRDLAPLRDLSGLESLALALNPVADLEPLRDLLNLKQLTISGNSVASLEPLRKLVQLKLLRLGDSEFPRPGFNPTTLFGFFDTPVVDAGALGDLPLLANPFIVGNHIRITLHDRRKLVDEGDADMVTGGEAIRLGSSNRFNFFQGADTGSPPDDQLVFYGAAEETFISEDVEPFVLVAARFLRRRQSGFALCRRRDPSNGLGVIAALPIVRRGSQNGLNTALVSVASFVEPDFFLSLQAVG